MARVVLMMTISLDGFVSGPRGHAAARPEPVELKRWKLERINRAGAHAMGRVTYEEMASHWPSSTDAYAAPMNEIPKIVFSKTLTEAAWPETAIARGDLADEIATLRRRPGGDVIAWGGASFAQALSRAGLVDEYVLVVNPILLGGGLSMFGERPDALPLELIEAQGFDTGAALLVYRPA